MMRHKYRQHRESFKSSIFALETAVGAKSGEAAASTVDSAIPAVAKDARLR